MKKLFLKSGTCLLALMLCVSSTVSAASKKKRQPMADVGTTITLVTTGTGATKEEATKNALRSALEQTYGAFVSANSAVVNDELVRDEIVSVSAGNIVDYEELSFRDTNPKQVTVKAVVSITRLASYAQNKGMAAELAGNTFAMNFKMEELNKQNEEKALANFLIEANSMCEKLFDYEIIVSDPQDRKKVIQVPVKIKVKANKNTISFYELLHNTLNSLATSSSTGLIPGLSIYFDGYELDLSDPRNSSVGIGYKLRGDHSWFYKFNKMMHRIITTGFLRFKIIDNLGNVSGFTFTKAKKDIGLFIYDGNNDLYLYAVCANKLSPNSDSWRGGGEPRIIGQRNYRHRSIYMTRELVFDHWLNKRKPVEGEVLYTIDNISLQYSLDEISKISKIEIRPIE